MRHVGKIIVKEKENVCVKAVKARIYLLHIDRDSITRLTDFAITSKLVKLIWAWDSRLIRMLKIDLQTLDGSRKWTRTQRLLLGPLSIIVAMPVDIVPFHCPFTL